MNALENIAELWVKGKYSLIHGGEKDQALILLVLLAVALGAFACGRLSIIEERTVPVRVENIPGVSTGTTTSVSSSEKEVITPVEEGIGDVPAPGSVVGSRNGTKYHFPWCSGAQTIKEENKIWFASESAAQSAGYTKAGNCR